MLKTDFSKSLGVDGVLHYQGIVTAWDSGFVLWSHTIDIVRLTAQDAMKDAHKYCDKFETGMANLQFPKQEIEQRKPHLLICLDEDERTTLINRYHSYQVAELKLSELDARYPNGAFDLVHLDDVTEIPPKTELTW